MAGALAAYHTLTGQPHPAGQTVQGHSLQEL